MIDEAKETLKPPTCPAMFSETARASIRRRPCPRAARPTRGWRSTRAGIPATVVPAGTSSLTTAFAPTQARRRSRSAVDLGSGPDVDVVADLRRLSVELADDDARMDPAVAADLGAAVDDDASVVGDRQPGAEDVPRHDEAEPDRQPPQPHSLDEERERAQRPSAAVLEILDAAQAALELELRTAQHVEGPSPDEAVREQVRVQEPPVVVPAADEVARTARRNLHVLVVDGVGLLTTGGAARGELAERERLGAVGVAEPLVVGEQRLELGLADRLRVAAEREVDVGADAAQVAQR